MGIKVLERLLNTRLRLCWNRVGRYRLSLWSISQDWLYDNLLQLITSFKSWKMTERLILVAAVVQKDEQYWELSLRKLCSRLLRLQELWRSWTTPIVLLIAIIWLLSLISRSFSLLGSKRLAKRISWVVEALRELSKIRRLMEWHDI